MKLYLAARYTSNFHMRSSSYRYLDDRERQAYHDVRYLLESYHYIGKGAPPEHIRKDGVKVFLDSGAFSSFTKGKVIDIKAYCDFIKRNKDIVLEEDGILLASVLDAIGDPDETYRNQVRMEQMGVKPLPCFHYNEPIEVLEYYIEHYDYITLGGMVPITTPQLQLWLDRMWDRYLTDENGVPRIKVHGFGMTSPSLMDRYPWYSVDSSSWVQYALFGWLWIPGHGSLQVSDQSSAVKEAGKHLNNLAPEQREAVEDLIREQGFDPQRMRDSVYSRQAYNMFSFTWMMDEVVNKRPARFVCPQPVLF